MALLEQGAELPEDLHRVEVSPVAQPYRDAFLTLSMSRGRGAMGELLPIQYSEIVEYGYVNGFGSSQVDLQELVQLVQAQDAVYLEHAYKKK